MLEPLKKFWANPYAAPLTGAVDGVVRIARAPINEFIKGVKKSFDDNSYRYDSARQAQGKMGRLFHEANKYDSGFGMITIGGAAVGAVAFCAAGAAAGVALMGGIAGKAVAATVLGLAFAGVGAVAGPFIIAGVAATVGTLVGLGIGMVPGFFKGCSTALKYHKEKKTQAVVTKALPPAQAQDAELTKNLTQMMGHFNGLPQEHKAAFVRMMNEKYEQAAPGAQSDKALAVIDAMPEKDREIFIHALKERLKDDFDAVAQSDADKTVTLQAPITTGSAIKLKKAV